MESGKDEGTKPLLKLSIAQLWVKQVQPLQELKLWTQKGQEILANEIKNSFVLFYIQYIKPKSIFKTESVLLLYVLFLPWKRKK